MWQEISSISGLPFPRSPSLVDNNNGALYTNSRGSRPQSATTLHHLSTDNGTRSTTRSVAQLQSDLLRSTNHAISSEIKIGNLKDQIARYEHKIACQQQQSNELSENLQSCRNDLHHKDETISSLSRDNNTLKNSLEKTEKDLSSRIAELEHDLSSQRVIEETLRLDRQKTLQELDNTTKKNEALQKQVADLQDNLRETVEASKQREKRSLVEAQTKGINDMVVMEAKLQNVTQQLAKAEEREQQSSISAQEARQETSNLHQMHNNNINNLRRELSQQHKVEVDKIRLELDNAKQDITHLSAQLQESHNSLAKQSAKATKNLSDAENRIKDINHELESKSEQCERLEMELNEVRYRIVGRYIHIIRNLTHNVTSPHMYVVGK